MIFLKQMGNFKMERSIFNLLIAVGILIVFSTLIFASGTIKEVNN